MFKQHLANWLHQFPPLRWGLALAVRLFAPRNYVGAVGAVFNDAGQVLMVEHVFRPNYAWGLPGGWVNRGEDPAHAIEREIEEELNLKVRVKKLLICEPQGGGRFSTTPLGLGLAFYCRPAENSASPSIEQAHSAYEVLGMQWVFPHQINWPLLPLQEKAIVLGTQEFEREQPAA